MNVTLESLPPSEAQNQTNKKSTFMLIRPLKPMAEKILDQRDLTLGLTSISSLLGFSFFLMNMYEFPEKLYTKLSPHYFCQA